MTRRDASKLIGRFFVVFLCCCPIFVLIAWAVENKISSFVEVVIFMTICAGIFVIEELLYVKALKKREAQKELTDVDKFFEEQREKRLAKKRKKSTKKDTSQNTAGFKKDDGANQNVSVSPKDDGASKNTKSGKKEGNAQQSTTANQKPQYVPNGKKSGKKRK